ncbi:ureidoglycolate hydrolase [Sedimentitalea sp. CY04]|uniref:Ureidoglycolate hydrolase n=1 Tax=Parasedimentitalea denitrificans TaxID=2211118 RepID=A0ABX0W7L7_9RHOB|nr:ureidoglycolate lyase [Sedimentitalea sp. CY04]NIZ61263.1 ureidoglycolate hydrolase [Sedimentitalea sp. CY04]
MSDDERFDYMNPDVAAGLPHFEVPLVRATPESFAGYGTIVSDHTTHQVPITKWPHNGWRPVDPGTGDEGGYLQGDFDFWWEGEVLLGQNLAVQDKYILGWSVNPEDARWDAEEPDRSKLLIWHANHHPDGGQLFYPMDNQPFIAALAKTDDDMKPEDWVAFYCDGSFGICIDAGIWHEAIVPLVPKARFFDKQGAVHARVSADFPKEFGVLLSVPLDLKKMQEG